MPLVSLHLPPDLATSAPIKTAPGAPWAAAARPGSVAAVLRELPLGARPGRGRPGGVSGPRPRPQQDQRKNMSSPMLRGLFPIGEITSEKPIDFHF